MIGKVIRGERVSALLRYLYGPGRYEEHIDPRAIAGSGEPGEWQPSLRPNGRPDTRRLAARMAEPVARLHRRPAKPVWHCVVANPATDRRLSDAEWAHVAADIMDRTGLARRGDAGGCRWVAVRHADDHIHVVATLARQDGTAPRLRGVLGRVYEASLAAERDLRLAAAPRRDLAGTPPPSRAELERAAREGLAEPPRDTLRRRVQVAAAGATSSQEFLARLHREGMVIRLRESASVPGTVCGYAVGLPGYRAAAGNPVWFGGRTLGGDLTLSKLHQRWAAAGQPAAEIRPPAGPGSLAGQRLLAPAERIPAIRRAAAAAARAAVRLRMAALTCPTADGATPPRPAPGTTDPAAAAPITPAAAAPITPAAAAAITPAAAAATAYAATDLYVAAARMVDGPRLGELTRAADAYARSAREPLGAVPPATAAAAGLRDAARGLLAVGRLATAGELAATRTLLPRLAGLADALAALRAAQDRPAQADAARRAARGAATAGRPAYPLPAPARFAGAPTPPGPRPHRTGRAAS